MREHDVKEPQNLLSVGNVSYQHEYGHIWREGGEGEAGAGDDAAGDADRATPELVDQPADDGAGHEVHAAQEAAWWGQFSRKIIHGGLHFILRFPTRQLYKTRKELVMGK